MSTEVKRREDQGGLATPPTVAAPRPPPTVSAPRRRIPKKPSSGASTGGGGGGGNFEQLHARDKNGVFTAGADANRGPHKDEPAAGTSGPRVAQLQDILNQLGYADQKPLSKDGKFGPATAEALRRAQANLHVTGEDGFLGPKTRAALRAERDALTPPATGRARRRTRSRSRPRPSSRHAGAGGAAGGGSRYAGAGGMRSTDPKAGEWGHPWPSQWGAEPPATHGGARRTEGYPDGSAAYEDGTVYDPAKGKFRKRGARASGTADAGTKRPPRRRTRTHRQRRQHHRTRHRSAGTPKPSLQAAASADAAALERMYRLYGIKRFDPDLHPRDPHGRFALTHGPSPEGFRHVSTYRNNSGVLVTHLAYEPPDKTWSQIVAGRRLRDLIAEDLAHLSTLIVYAATGNLSGMKAAQAPDPVPLIADCFAELVQLAEADTDFGQDDYDRLVGKYRERWIQLGGTVGMQKSYIGVLERKALFGAGHKVLDAENGIVEAIVSVTGVKDEVNDIIMPGAYAKTLARRTPKGVDAHDWAKPVSRALRVRELLPGDAALPTVTARGEPWPAEAGALVVEAQFNLEKQAARDVFSDVKFYQEEMEWSIGYNVPRGGARIDQKSGTRYIGDIELFEFSTVLFGANTLSGTVGVKGFRIGEPEIKALPGSFESRINAVDTAASALFRSELGLTPGEPINSENHGWVSSVGVFDDHAVLCFRYADGTRQEWSYAYTYDNGNVTFGERQAVDVVEVVVPDTTPADPAEDPTHTETKYGEDDLVSLSPAEILAGESLRVRI